VGKQTAAWPFGDRFVDRRLRRTVDTLARLRSELAVVDEQLAHFEDEAHDMEIRALVSETALASFEHRDAERSRAAVARQRQHLLGQISDLERMQNDLLDRIAPRG
jgi:DNA transposition AAA+ family ATPase